MELVHAPCEILATLCVNEGKAVWTDAAATPTKWRAFIAVVPDLPNSLLTFYDTQGIKIHRYKDNNKTVFNPGFQVMSRAMSNAAGAWMANRIATYLDTVLYKEITIPQRMQDGINLPVSTYVIKLVIKSGPVLTAGQDEKRRFLNTVNGQLVIVQTS